MLTQVIAASLVTLGALQTVPAGWRSETGAKGVLTVRPADLKAGEVFALTFYPEASLRGSAPDAWLTSAIAQDPLPIGARDSKIVAKAERTAVAQALGKVNGQDVGLVYTASVVDGDRVRWVRLAVSGQNGLYARYKTETEAMVRAFTSGGKASAPVSPPALAGKPKLGGPIQEGVYVGNQTYGGKPRAKYRLHLYANGEYRIRDIEDGKEDKDGEYEYDPKTGYLTISSLYWLNTRKNDPNDAICVFGRDANGTPIVYANNDRGISRAITTLVYAGKLDRPSPRAEEAEKARKAEEAARYKFVVAPGKGLSNERIEAVVHNLENIGDGMGGMKQRNTVTILLKDGTAYNGFPAPPDMWDVPTSRAKEAAKWGKWKRGGAGYQVAWKGQGFVALPGVKVKPSPKGTRLNGRWGTGESSVNLMNSSYRLWGIKFTSGGQFIKDNRGGSGTSQFMQTGTGTAINSTYDDKGSYTSATGGNFVVGTGKKAGPDAHRKGAYSIEGYTLVLRYDNGKVVRMPFFMKSNKYRDMFFEGYILAKDDK
jgi:hypothetical protein